MQRACGGRRCFIVAPGEKIRIGKCCLYLENQRIERAEMHGADEVFDRRLLLATEELDPAADVPCRGQVRIERKGPVDENGSAVHIATHRGNCMGGLGESDSVILGQLNRLPREPRAFRSFARPVDDPAVRLALNVAVGGHPVSGREFGIDLNGPMELAQRIAYAIPTPPVQLSQTAQVTIQGTNAVGWLAPRAIDLDLLQL